MGVLEHVTFADPDAGVDVLERLLRSPEFKPGAVIAQVTNCSIDGA